jgi:hypothetical protein
LPYARACLRVRASRGENNSAISATSAAGLEAAGGSQDTCCGVLLRRPGRARGSLAGSLWRFRHSSASLSAQSGLFPSMSTTGGGKSGRLGGLCETLGETRHAARSSAPSSARSGQPICHTMGQGTTKTNGWSSSTWQMTVGGSPPHGYSRKVRAPNSSGPQYADSFVAARASAQLFAPFWSTATSANDSGGVTPGTVMHHRPVSNLRTDAFRLRLSVPSLETRPYPRAAPGAPCSPCSPCCPWAPVRPEAPARPAAPEVLPEAGLPRSPARVATCP